MSHRGNCWVNAPQESFFGHMKDELPDLHQWNLAKFSLNQYDEFIKAGEYPLKKLVPTPERPMVLQS